MPDYPNQTQPNTPHLTPTEVVVLKHVAKGFSSKQIAETMELSKRTVDFHLGNIYSKLHVSNRIQAANQARILGLLE